MSRFPLALAGALVLFLAGLTWAGDAGPQLATAHGVVDKVGRDTLSIRPRNDEGQFAKTLVLKLTGTSKVWIMTQQKRGGSLVPVQKEAEAKELAPRQTVAVIYTNAKGGPVLLSAVALPAAK